MAGCGQWLGNRRGREVEERAGGDWQCEAVLFAAFWLAEFTAALQTLVQPFHGCRFFLRDRRVFSGYGVEVTELLLMWLSDFSKVLVLTFWTKHFVFRKVLCIFFFKVYPVVCSLETYLAQAHRGGFSVQYLIRREGVPEGRVNSIELGVCIRRRLVSADLAWVACLGLFPDTAFLQEASCTWVRGEKPALLSKPWCVAFSRIWAANFQKLFY